MSDGRGCKLSTVTGTAYWTALVPALGALVAASDKAAQIAAEISSLLSRSAFRVQRGECGSSRNHYFGCVLKGRWDGWRALALSFCAPRSTRLYLSPIDNGSPISFVRSS